MLRATLLLFLFSTLAISQTDPFQGSFAGDQLEIQLRPAADGSYAGQLVFGGQTYPITARRTGQKLDGSFTSQGHQYQLAITPTSDGLRLVSDGAVYKLIRAPNQASVPVRQASSPGRRHRHESGFGLMLPSGWTAQDNPQGTILIPAGVTYDPSRNDNPEVYVAGVHDAVDPAGERQLVQELSSAFLTSGVELTRAGDRQQVAQGGAVYHWEYRTPRYPTTVGLKIYVAAAAARTFVVLGAGEAQRVNSRDLPLREILTSMDFQQPKMPEAGPLADNTPQAQEWLQKLRGKVIKQFSGGGGMSAEKTRFLAADGTYSMKSSSVVSIDVGPYGGAPTASASSIGRNSQTGRWKIRDENGRIFLQIWTGDGQVLMLPITRDSRNWYLNGEKAFAVNP
jgi:hypothetical protein